MDYVRNLLHIISKENVNSDSKLSLEDSKDFPKYFVSFSRCSWKIGKNDKSDEKDKITQHTDLSILKNTDYFVYFKI